ncbi:hypothetical protein [Fructobacillus durionis]|uniref:Uncharacterized protein n=1 Tax=Fructobacillus durionis TaxID=283737 RepID=A0A1I1G2L8_9LACO|nr:hypothetical protein [Fructobacillus durionis]SFC06069.1 hypothetical protein SAMN05660453_0963 [Fructobacillus durionis]
MKNEMLAKSIANKYHNSYAELQVKASQEEFDIVLGYISALTNEKMRQNVGLE